MELIKIEDGLLDGEVLFHKYIQKTEEEVAEIRKRREKRRKEKERRKKEQETNVKKKENLKKMNKEKSLEGMKKFQEGLSGRDKKAIRDFEGENAEKVSMHWILLVDLPFNYSNIKLLYLKYIKTFNQERLLQESEGDDDEEWYR